MSTSTVTLRELIDRAYARLQEPQEAPEPVRLGAELTLSSTQLTLSEGADTVAVSDLLEFGSELVMVTGSSAGNFSVVRGYLGTPVAPHGAGEVGRKSPTVPRWQVREAVVEALTDALTGLLPELSPVTVVVPDDGLWIPLPSDTVAVSRVAGLSADGRLVEFSAWDFWDDLPDEIAEGGKAINVSSRLTVGDALFVTIAHPYRLYDLDGQVVDPVEADEDAVVRLPKGAGDLPVLWAVAKLATGRRVPELELNSIKDWNQEAAYRQGVNVRVVQQLWAEFYRRVDEAKRARPMQRHRPYKRMRRF